MPCFQCELPEILEATRPPDPEMVDLIEQAFLEGQIDGEAMMLACLWLEISAGSFDKAVVRQFPKLDP